MLIIFKDAANSWSFSEPLSILIHQFSRLFSADIYAPPEIMNTYKNKLINFVGIFSLHE